MTYDRPLLARIVTWLIAGLVIILVLRLAFFLLGNLIGIGMFLLFTLVPILLVGWLAMKLWNRLGTGSRSDF